MHIQELKRWHWAVLGLLIGLMAAWGWSNLKATGALDTRSTLGSSQFEKLLLAKPLEGHPQIKNMTVSRENGMDVVRMSVLEPDPAERHPANRRHYRYVREQLNATAPYLPGFREAPMQSVMIRVNPSAVALPRQPGRQRAEPLPLWINGAAVSDMELAGRLRLSDGWSQQPGKWADPGPGADLSLVLRPADYRLLIVLTSSQSKTISPSDLSISLNGHALPPVTPAQKSSGPALETTVPHDAFEGTGPQVLRFSRKDAPVRIWEVRLIDPNYSVVNYLTYLHGRHPEISWSRAWWDSARMRYLLCGVGGVFLLGGLGPLLARLLTGAQPGKRIVEPEYDLNRFKGEPAPPQLATAQVDFSHDLSTLEEELAKGLNARAAPKSQPARPSPAPVKLNADPVQAPAAVTVQHQPSEYKGEFYPVARKAQDKDTGRT